jgi:hypothetical protein
MPFAVRPVAILALLALAACAAPKAAGQELPSDKVFVCKYTNTPGAGEQLQTGQNPISVSINAIPEGVPIEPGSSFQDSQGRSIILAFDVGQPDPSPSECPPPGGGTTTTTAAGTTTTTSPTPGQFSFPSVEVLCVDDELVVEITFPDRPDLDGDVGTLIINEYPGGDLISDQELAFDSGAVVQVPFPEGFEQITLTYLLGDEEVTVGPLSAIDCEEPGTTTTTTTPPGVTTTTTSPGQQPPPPPPTTTVRPPAVAPPGGLPGTR